MKPYIQGLITGILLTVSAMMFMGANAMESYYDNDDLMIINKSGITIRLAVDSLRVMGRATQGVKLINLTKNDEIAAIAKVPKANEDEELNENNNEDNAGDN